MLAVPCCGYICRQSFDAQRLQEVITLSAPIIWGFVKTLQSDRSVRGAHHLGPDVFERLYAANIDPWALSVSPMAHQRYLALLHALGPFTPCRSILDVGCGEGHFTRFLAGMSTNVVGIDVSASAVERAAEHVPAARFICAGLHEYEPPEVFDIVTAVEMLYYVRPVDRALSRLLQLGRTVIVSYSKKHRDEVAAVIEQHPRLTALDFCPFFGMKRFGFTIARFDGLTGVGI